MPTAPLLLMRMRSTSPLPEGDVLNVNEAPVELNAPMLPMFALPRIVVTVVLS